MFKFLKEKLKSAINKFSKDVEAESDDIELEQVPEIQAPETIGVEKPEDTPEEVPEVKDPEVVPEIKEEPEIIKEAPEIKEETKEPVKEEPEIKEAKEPEKLKKPVKVQKPTETLDFEPDIQIPDVPKEPEVAKVEKPDIAEVEEPVKKSFIGKLREKVTGRTLSDNKFETLFWELEVVLLENNVAVDVIEKLKDDLRQDLVKTKIPMGKTEKVILDALSKSIGGLFDESIDLFAQIAKKKPYVIMFVGVNGVGKTTSIAKMAYLLKKQKLKSVIAASDTFRAAAIQQIEAHANKLGIKLIKHDYGSDPAAVAFDATKYAQAKGIDVVLVDTAGRQHSNKNLIEEMKKIVRVSKPDLKVFVGESLTGNDCIEQAKEFNKAIGIDAIILTKADVDDKGGTAVSISYVTKKPIIYLGMGQEYDNLQEFNKNMITENLGL